MKKPIRFYNNVIAEYRTFESVSGDVLWPGPAERQRFQGRETIYPIHYEAAATAAKSPRSRNAV